MLEIVKLVKKVGTLKSKVAYTSAVPQHVWIQAKPKKWLAGSDGRTSGSTGVSKAAPRKIRLFSLFGFLLGTGVS